MENRIKYSKGLCWVSNCRIPFVDEGENTTRGKYENKVQVGIMAERPNIKFVGSFDDTAKQGRFTPNLLVCDDMLNDGNVSKSNSGGISSGNNFGGLTQKYRDRKGVDDKGTNSRYYDLDLWFNKMLEML